MQTAIRSIGAQHMTEKDHAKFTGLHAEGKLVKPAEAGAVLAGLAMKGEKKWSGEFVSWDASDMDPYRSL
jgi:hypothetical protein